MKLVRVAKKHKIITSVVCVLALLVIGGAVVYAFKPSKVSQDAAASANDAPVQQASPEPTTDQPEQKPEETVPPKNETPTYPPDAQWPVQLTASEAASITVVVNKKHKLPSTYAPALGPSGRLRAEAESAFNSMLAAAKASGAPSMTYVSGYRSYAKQEQLYNNYVAQDGQAEADTYSARPGFSEHQTGLAVDIGETGSGCDLGLCFENTASAKWVAANAHTYGFVVRYPKGKEAVTGYQYEPWHLRYIGAAEAAAVYASGKTLEEYYGVPGGGYE